MGKTWVCYYEPDIKEQSMDSKHINFLVKEKVLKKVSKKSVKGPIAIDFLERFPTVSLRLITKFLYKIHLIH